jgi:hypothetical protein
MKPTMIRKVVLTTVAVAGLASTAWTLKMPKEEPAVKKVEIVTQKPETNEDANSALVLTGLLIAACIAAYAATRGPMFGDSGKS